MADTLEQQIQANGWTLFDKVMYGGFGYGAFCLPTNFFKIVFTIIFPPLGEVINIIGDYMLDSFPYITWDSVKQIFLNLNRIIYSFILTSLFYIPGLIYSLSNITCSKSGSILNNPVITIPATYS
jgi:uncharacterized membrane protein YqaE (UPF0057 family)